MKASSICRAASCLALVLGLIVAVTVLVNGPAQAQTQCETNCQKGFDKDAERYLGAIAYRFNRRFDLHALPERLLVAAVTTGPRPEHWIRMPSAPNFMVEIIAFFMARRNATRRSSWVAMFSATSWSCDGRPGWERICR